MVVMDRNGRHFRLTPTRFRQLAGAGLLLCLLAGGGCSALQTREVRTGYFLGVRSDAAWLFDSGFDSEQPPDRFLAIMDFPFSLVGDVLFLPLDIHDTHEWPHHSHNLERDHQPDQLVGEIHSDLRQLKKDHAWLSEYNADCWDHGRTIFYRPPMKTSSGAGAQQPDLLFVGYQTVIEEHVPKTVGGPIIYFPSLQSQLYAQILVRGPDNAETASAIRECILARCAALQEKLKSNQP
jgi:uncharacterized protein YceK